MALPLGELSPKVTERALQALPISTGHCSNDTHLRLVIPRSEATWQSREGICSSYKPPLKWCVPIVSVAVLPKRHAVWQSLRHTFCGARLPSLSLRGGRRATWRPEREARGSALGVQSRGGSCVFADRFLAIRPGSARLPRPRWGLAMTNLGALRCNVCRSHCQSARRSLSAATDAIGAYHFNGSRHDSAVPYGAVGEKSYICL